MTLLIGIVPRGKGELLTSAANEVGARGGTIIMCRGTESNLALQLFGLGDIAKDTVLDPAERQQSLPSSDVAEGIGLPRRC